MALQIDGEFQPVVQDSLGKVHKVMNKAETGVLCVGTIEPGTMLVVRLSEDVCLQQNIAVQKMKGQDDEGRHSAKSVDNSVINITLNSHSSIPSAQPRVMQISHIAKPSSGPKNQPGELSKHFSNLFELCDGIFGTVLHGTLKVNCQACAIKVVPSCRNTTFEEHRKLADKLMQLSKNENTRSLNIVKVNSFWYEQLDANYPISSYPFDIYSEDDIKSLFFVSMEFCTANDLHNYFGRSNRDSNLDEDLKSQIILGLDYLHQADIVLGNLDPSNILLTFAPTGDLIAKIGGYIFDRNSRELEQESERYMAKYYESPEIYKPVKASDIYSLGVILFAFHVPMRDGNGKLMEDYCRVMERFRFGEFPPNYPGDEFHKKFLRKMTHRSPSVRPSMQKILQFVLSDVIKCPSDE